MNLVASKNAAANAAKIMEEGSGTGLGSTWVSWVPLVPVMPEDIQVGG